MSEAAVTVLVPTVGRPGQLTRLLSALGVQQDPGVPWSVLVVDNGPGEQAAVAVERLHLTIDVRVVHEPRAGASHARNRGVAEASAPWVALLDDDVQPAPDWLARLVGGARDGGFDLAGGKVVLDPATPLPSWLSPDLQGFVTALDLGAAARPLAPEEYVLTANALARTDLLRRVPFDPVLGPRPDSHLTNDDLDLVRRVRAAGASVGWIPDALVVHDAPRERLRLRWFARRAFQQGRSDRRLHAEEAAGARLGGLRAGWWHLRDRVRWWWRHRLGRRSFLVHVLVESARTLGWWRESLAAVRRR